MNRAIDYLQKYIDDNAAYVHYDQEARKKLNMQLAGSFDFFKVTVLGQTVLFIKPVEKYTIGKIKSWMQTMEEKFDMPVAVIMDDLSPYMTKKLLMDRVAFIVPGKQISLPFLAMSIKNTRTKPTKEIKKFVPATQLIFLYILYADHNDFEIVEIKKELDISSITVSRGMEDLTSLGLLTYDITGKTGRKKIFHRVDRKEYYSVGKKYIDNPVRDIVYIDQLPNGITPIKTDLTALAEQTMLGEPTQMRYALNNKEKCRIEKYMISKEQAAEENSPMIFLYKYNVQPVAKDGYIDPISLIAGLTEYDERIEMSIEELMEDKEWFEE